MSKFNICILRGGGKKEEKRKKKGDESFLSPCEGFSYHRSHAFSELTKVNCP